jgi:hypothetical protein
MKSEVCRNLYQQIQCDELSLLASVLFRAPMDTITRGAETFSMFLAHFDNIPTGWVSNISQRPNIHVDFLLQLGWSRYYETS